MITDQKIKSELYRLIRGSRLHHELSGDVYKTDRPVDSDKEDVVISVSGNQAGQTQWAYANVNVYVKDVHLCGQWLEDTRRTEEIAEICQDMFTVVDGSIGDSPYQIVLQNQSTIKERDREEHFVNNRLLVKLLN